MKSLSLSTRLIRDATRRGGGRRPVNPPLERASTMLNDDAARLANTDDGPVYGLDGLSAARALTQALCELEGAERAWVFPSGLAALTAPLLALLHPGDEVLSTDGLYWPTRRFLKRYLEPRGISHALHPVSASVDEIMAMTTERTRLILIESPASLTFEMVDVPALADAARRRGILTVMDNTWAAGVAFKPLAHGVDVSVQALTKYVGGHSDILMGSVATRDASVGLAIESGVEDLGWHVSPDDAWLALRGLRTLTLRYKAQGRSAFAIAEHLSKHPKIELVHYPALPHSPAHAEWMRHYDGAPGLLSFHLRATDDAAITLLNELELFGLGYSWGGFESLATPETIQLRRRIFSAPESGPLVRIHVGLEEVSDLIDDIEQALGRLA